jgi:hypothetical protein
MRKIPCLIIFMLLMNFLFASVKGENKLFMPLKTKNVSLKLNMLPGYEIKVIKNDSGKIKTSKNRKITLTVGYGLDNLTKTLFKPYYSFNAFTYKAFGPLHFKAEYGISEKIGIGLSVNYISGMATWEETFDPSISETIVPGKWDYYSFSILPRMNYYFKSSNKFDFYLGVGIGYRKVSWVFSSPYPSCTTSPKSLTSFSFAPFGFEAIYGLRYFITNNIGFYSEIGFAKAIIQGGLIIKL